MIPFTKMQGLGNDFVVLDALRDVVPDDLPEFARLACDRRRGIGGDGVLLVERGTDAPFRMRMLNPDGSESEMCGNGLRCAAALLRERGYAEGAAEIETGAGVLRAAFEGEAVAVDMGVARLTRGEIGMAGPPDEVPVLEPLSPLGERGRGEGPVSTLGQAGTKGPSPLSPDPSPPEGRGESEALGRVLGAVAVSMGNPHLVVFVEDADAVDLHAEGARLERHREFPQRTNVHFVQVLGPDEARVRVWERGAGATLACGTGACAVAVAGVETGRLGRRSTIRLPGGPLTIEVGEDRRVTMTGPAETVFEGALGVRD